MLSIISFANAAESSFNCNFALFSRDIIASSTLSGFSNFVSAARYSNCLASCTSFDTVVVVEASSVEEDLFVKDTGDDIEKAEIYAAVHSSNKKETNVGIMIIVRLCSIDAIADKQFAKSS